MLAEPDRQSLRFLTGQVIRRRGLVGFVKGLTLALTGAALGLTLHFFPNSPAGRYIARWMERHRPVPQSGA